MIGRSWRHEATPLTTRSGGQGQRGQCGKVRSTFLNTGVVNRKYSSVQTTATSVPATTLYWNTLFNVDFDVTPAREQDVNRAYKMPLVKSLFQSSVNDRGIKFTFLIQR
jgi:hypothetical protein